MRWSAGERGSGGALSKKVARGGSALSGASEAGRKGRSKARVEGEDLYLGGETRRGGSDARRIGSGVARLISPVGLECRCFVMSALNAPRGGRDDSREEGRVRRASEARLL